MDGYATGSKRLPKRRGMPAFVMPCRHAAPPAIIPVVPPSDDLEIETRHLLGASYGGSDEAFDRLCLLWRQLLIRRFMGSRYQCPAETAEELYQIVIFNLLKTVDSARRDPGAPGPYRESQGAAVAWIHKIGHNAFVDSLPSPDRYRTRRYGFGQSITPDGWVWMKLRSDRPDLQIRLWETENPLLGLQKLLEERGVRAALVSKDEKQWVEVLVPRGSVFWVLGSDSKQNWFPLFTRVEAKALPDDKTKRTDRESNTQEEDRELPAHPPSLDPHSRSLLPQKVDAALWDPHNVAAAQGKVDVAHRGSRPDAAEAEGKREQNAFFETRRSSVSQRKQSSAQELKRLAESLPLRNQILIRNVLNGELLADIRDSIGCSLGTVHRYLMERVAVVGTVYRGHVGKTPDHAEFDETLSITADKFPERYPWRNERDHATRSK